MNRYPIACVLTEPALQNVGIIHPQPGYLEGILDLCEEFGAVSIFDEVKTGFRTALGGYQSLSGLKPDLSVFGKAIANGYPLGIVGGKKEIMRLFHDDNPNLKVLIAGTYNAHPVNTNAAIATLKILKDESVYQQLDTLCSQLYDGLHSVLKEKAIPFSLVSNASAFCIYFSENAPKDAHDILLHHDFDLDMKFRRGLIQKGIYHIPIAAKQGSVSTAHSIQDIAKTLDITRQVLADI
jgi:glutamate-1-semialdehyde 2,1-aminomutase